MKQSVKAVYRELPDGQTEKVFPFHISLEGLKQQIICRDDKDCDVMVKILAVCALRKNVIVIIYAVVSNHAHIAVLARTYDEALAYAQEVKRVYSMYFRKKYGEAKVLRETDVCVKYLDTYQYLRNALAYIPRNAYDNGAQNIADYKWTGFRACFRKADAKQGVRSVDNIPVLERRKIFHTGDNLKGRGWVLNAEDELEPYSFCDTAYLEKAFFDEETLFYKTVGGLNSSEMTQDLVVSPRKMKTDAAFLREVNELSERWFECGARDLSPNQRARILPYIYHSIRTSVPQICRALGLSREEARRLLCLPE